MKKKQVDEILVNQAKRRRNSFILISIIVLCFIIGFYFLILFFQRNKDYFVSYKEANNTSYIVSLKENEFFEKDYLDENNEFISSLVDSINANFNYKLSLDEGDVSYKYNYRIEADVNVKRKNSGNSLYKENKVLLDSIEMYSNDKDIIINEDIKIDYNEYNNVIKKFINMYSLDDVESYLTVNMYINVIGSCENFEKSANKESVISIKIPLNTRVVDIEISDNLLNNVNNLIQCKKMYENAFVFLIIAIVFFGGSASLIFVTIKYIISTRTAENIYERELRKILNTYGSYIQTLNNDFNFKSYQILIIRSFNDMLEIRDTVGQPILMKENQKKDGAYFIIPGMDKILYTYRLKVTDIEKEMNKED